MMARITLPNRRHSETFDVVHGDQCFRVSVGTDLPSPTSPIFELEGVLRLPEGTLVAS
jgi:hypothetical protein